MRLPNRARTRGVRLWTLFLCGSRVACGGGSDRVETEPEVPAEFDYMTTLSRLPVDFASHLTMSGTGRVTGQLVDGGLVLEGMFQGVESPVDSAHLHRARPGLRGPPVASLEVTLAAEGTSGTLSGTVALSADLLQALEDKELYVKIHSEANPEGVLRGWLFPLR